MTIKKLLLASLFSLLLLVSKGQQLEIRPSIGMGTYSMSKLKDLMQESVEESSFNLKTVENFPSNAFYKLDIIQYSNEQLGWGITTGFYSTGARNQIADYSGYFREDLKVSSINLGFLVSQKKPLGNHFLGYLEFASGIKFYKIMVENELNVTAGKSIVSDEARSQGWWIEPQLRVSRLVGKNFSVAAFAAYEFMMIKNLKLTEESYRGTEIDWSGVRAGVSFSFIQK